METLMIHDIRPDYFKLELDKYNLTFDDGLFSQYYYFPVFSRYRSERIYFITTSFIKSGKIRPMFKGEHLRPLKSKEYMYAALIKGEFDYFVNTEELKVLSTQENVKIGAHSHTHDVIITARHPRKKKKLSQWKLERFKNHPEISQKNYSIRSKLAFQGYNLINGKITRRSESEREDYIKYDTERCLAWFNSKLKFIPEIYCFPFNEYNDKMISILKSFGFKKFYGARPKEGKDVLRRIDIDSLETP